MVPSTDHELTGRAVQARLITRYGQNELLVALSPGSGVTAQEEECIRMVQVGTTDTMEHGLRSVRGLEDLWSNHHDGGRARPVPLHAMLDTLGLGLEQVMSHLGRERPDWEGFLAWAAATASGGDVEAIKRYHAWYDGAVIPCTERMRQKTVLAQPPVFSDAEMRGWERDGFIVLRQAITADEAGAIAEHLWTLQGAIAEDPATWYGGREHGIMVQEFQHPTMEVPRRAPRIHRAFAQLYGHADLIASVDRLSFNPPENPDYVFPGPHLHWDANLTPPITFETQGILYLTDTAADQGALSLVPGFHHRMEDWLRSIGDDDPRTFDLASEAVPIGADTGDLVIWRQDLPHGASANTSERPRLAQYVTLRPMQWPDERPWR